MINLENASSGQQEILPLLILLKILPFVRIFLSRGITIYIEEPEAHLFPVSQKSVVELISIIFNKSQMQSQFIITTHSPYIISSFNNLLQAGEIETNSSPAKKNKLYNIVPKDKIINISNFRAYALEKGKQTNLISKQTGLISTNIIDQVSNDLAIKFDKILGV